MKLPKKEHAKAVNTNGSFNEETEKIEWFDSNICVGRPMNAGWKPLVSREDLLAAMDENQVSGSLIWHVAQFDGAPYVGNTMLEDWLQPGGNVLGCLALLPPCIDPLPAKKIFEGMKRSNCCAVRIFPVRNNYRIWALESGTLMNEIVERNIPVILSNEFGSNWDILADFLRAFPKATCIASDLGVWGQGRYLWPLLEKYPGLHVETGMLSIEAEGLATGVEEFGPSRFVFGSGFPRRYFGGAMADILFSDIAGNGRADIAGGNMKRLIGRINI